MLLKDALRLTHISRTSPESSSRPCRAAQRTSPWESAPSPSRRTSWRPQAARRAPCSASHAASPSGPPRRPTANVRSSGSPSTSCPPGAASWHAASSSAASTSPATARRSPTSWGRHCSPLGWWFLWWAWSWSPSPRRTGSSQTWRGPWATTDTPCSICDHVGGDILPENFTFGCKSERRHFTFKTALNWNVAFQHGSVSGT